MVRNRTKRVLRDLMSSRIGQLPDGVDVVIRAKTDLPGTRTTILAQDLDELLATVLRRAGSQEGR